jgi:hypothetical protein
VVKKFVAEPPRFAAGDSVVRATVVIEALILMFVGKHISPVSRKIEKILPRTRFDQNSAFFNPTGHPRVSPRPPLNPRTPV